MNGGHPARLLLCTGSAQLAGRLTALLDRWAAGCCVKIAVETAPALPAAAPDLLFLDADTVEVDGPERPAALEGAGLIVLSARPRSAIAACRWHAEAFLPAMPDGAALERAMDGCFQAWCGGLQWLDLPARRERVRLPLCQLRYAEASGRETELYCTGGCIRASVSLKELEALLPNPPFFRCQKAFLVHLSAAEALAGGVLTMADGREISVSRRQLAPLREALAAWREEGTVCASL